METSLPNNYRSQWGREIVDDIEQAEVTKGIVLWLLGGAGIGIRTREAVAYMDIYTGPSVAGVHRMCAVPLDSRDVGKCDALISTHDHEDHCDRDSMLPMWRNTNCRLVGPTSSARMFKEWGVGEECITALNPTEGLKVADLSITALQSNDCEDEEAVTYLLEADGVEVFAGGDTRYFDGLSVIAGSHDIDVALLSLGRNPPGQDVFMEARDLVRAAEALKARVLIPIHWDLWKEYMQDPQEVVRTAATMEARAEIHILRLGDRFDCAG